MIHNSHNAEEGTLVAVIGWTSSFAGQVLLFGVELMKAAALGFVGAAAGMLARYLWKKYFPLNKNK